MTNQHTALESPAASSEHHEDGFIFQLLLFNAFTKRAQAKILTYTVKLHYNEKFMIPRGQSVGVNA